MYNIREEYTEEELIKFAKKRIKIKKDLYSHITAYIVVNAFLIFVYYVNEDPSNTEMPWFVWILGGWGIGLIIDIVNTIQNLRFKYNTKAINRELEKIKRSLDR